jgi:hypothetical protein
MSQAGLPDSDAGLWARQLLITLHIPSICRLAGLSAPRSRGIPVRCNITVSKQANQELRHPASINAFFPPGAASLVALLSVRAGPGVAIL